jgi:hypothetical protein
MLQVVVLLKPTFKPEAEDVKPAFTKQLLLEGINTESQ